MMIVQKILLDDMGLNYICATAERFYAVSTVLSNMVAVLVDIPSARLLKHITRCYLRLTDNMRAREALRQCLPDALRAYRQVLDIETLDTETLDEARIAMASLVLSEEDAAEAQSILSTLAPDAISEVMAQAKLGEARSLLAEGQAAEAHPVFEGLVETTGLPTTIDRAARAGLGEALAQMGELREALDIWRELLAEPGSRHDRTQLELLVANGLLQGGRRKEASTALRSLADSDNAEARGQGLLGLAEVARASAERQAVLDICAKCGWASEWASGGRLA